MSRRNPALAYGRRYRQVTKHCCCGNPRKRCSFVCGPNSYRSLIEGLSDGTLDVIATDHAPHHRDEKDVEFDHAAFGISGFETALALTLGLVESGRIDLMEAVAKWTANPARVAGIPGGTLLEGAPADLVVVDQAARWTVDPQTFLSKGKNTPFAGMELAGQVVHTFVGGEKVYDRAEGIVK